MPKGFVEWDYKSRKFAKMMVNLWSFLISKYEKNPYIG